MIKKTVMLLGPSLGAVSGVSTHLNQLLQSPLARNYRLLHFQVGSEGRGGESRLAKAGRLVWSPLQLLVALLRHRPAIVHLNTSLDVKAFWRDVVYLALAKALGRAVVYQVHGGALPQQFFAGRPWLTGFLRRVLRSADAVVLLAQQELQAYRRFDGQIALSVIPNAIELIADPVHKQGRTGQPLALAFVGRLSHEKGLFELVEAIGLVRDAGGSATLVVAGSGPDEAALKARVAELNLGQRISFVGAVFGPQKHQVWLDADVFGFPTWREGLPYSLLEAMAARTPPLISPVGAIPDVMEDGVHGFFVPPRDAPALAGLILRLDGDRALLQTMQQAGRERVEEYYSLTRLADDFHQTYAQLAQ